MIKVGMLVRPDDDLTPQEFRERWEGHGVPALLDSIPDLKKLSRNYVTSSLNPPGWTPPFVALMFLSFESVRSLDAAMTVLRSDVASDLTATVWTGVRDTQLFVVDECESPLPSDLLTDTKVIIFLRRRDTLSPEEFRTRYETGHAVLAAEVLEGQLGRYVRNYVTQAQTASSTPSDFEVITEFWLRADPASSLSEDQRKVLVRDEEVFIDRSSMRILQVEELISTDRQPFAAPDEVAHPSKETRSA